MSDTMDPNKNVFQDPLASLPVQAPERFYNASSQYMHDDTRQGIIATAMKGVDYGGDSTYPETPPYNITMKPPLNADAWDGLRRDTTRW
jgi:hypothetical protein